MAKYKTKDGRLTGVVANVGVIVDGFIESEIDLSGPNFELVTDASPAEQPAPVVGVASQQNPDLNQTAGTPVNEEQN